MKATIVFLVLGAFVAPAHAGEPALKGRWVLTSEAQAGFAQSCRGMTLEFTADNRIVRTTGELKYTSTVVTTLEGSGWLLTEELESQNGKPGCGGKSAEEIVSHLRHEAYVEVRGSVLRYYGVKGAKKAMEFTRADAQQTVQPDRREDAAPG
jgi:hypothetical protein